MVGSSLLVNPLGFHADNEPPLLFHQPRPLCPWNILEPFFWGHDVLMNPMTLKMKGKLTTSWLKHGFRLMGFITHDPYFG